MDRMYSTVGRPSILPERLLKASLLMALYMVRSERLLCEQLGYNFLFRYFLDMNMVEEPFDHSSFSRNRARLLAHEVAREFLAAVVAQARGLNLLSDEHFSVDRTQIEAWASRKSYRPQEPPAGGGNASTGGVAPGPTARLRDCYESSTDPQARMYRKSKADKAQPIPPAVPWADHKRLPTTTVRAAAWAPPSTRRIRCMNIAPTSSALSPWCW